MKENGFVKRKSGKKIIGKEIIELPLVFSILEDSDEVIKLLKKYYGIVSDGAVHEVQFVHTRCKKLELAASTLMDIIVIAARQNRSDRGKELLFQGKFDASSREIALTLTASGLPKHLNADIKGYDYDRSEVLPLDVMSGKTGETRKSAENATKLTEYFDKCLHREKMELTVRGKEHFSTLFGEVLSNCEIHGGVSGTWYTQGLYLKKENMSEMQLLFLNIGDTIYEGLLKECSKETEEKLKIIKKRHRHFFSKNWTKEMLFTLIAMQDGISRFRTEDKEGYRIRGSGTVAMIETFQMIGKGDQNKNPKMVIVSGNTRMVFDGRYKMAFYSFDKDDVFGTGKKKMIAFNEDNDIYKPADSKNVMRTKHKFPGTIISLKFYLNRDYIQSFQQGRK